MDIPIINRHTRTIEKEIVWGGRLLELLYGDSLTSRVLGKLLLPVITAPLVTRLWGAYHDTRFSARAIKSFCTRFQLNEEEFLEPILSFDTFNAFFTRKLKPSMRPIAQAKNVATLPADARYTIWDEMKIEDRSTFSVKGSHFDLETFLQDSTLAALFSGGARVLARLCPLDCHRFYFPFDGIASAPKLIAGSYLSVNPIATNKHPSIFWSNIRQYTQLETEYGIIGIVEIGATNCAAIVQTYTPGKVSKGQEKGFFKLGGSAIMLLFQKGQLELAKDLVTLSKSALEIVAHFGEELGTLRPRK